MWKKTTQLHHDVTLVFLLLFRVAVVGVVFLSGTSWAKWPIEPPLDAAYVDWETFSIGVSGKAPPHFLVPSAAQSRSSAERLAKLNAAERLFSLLREWRLHRTLTFGECAPEEKLKAALADLLSSQAPTAHWRFSDGGQSFFFELPMALLAPLCPTLEKAMAQLPSVPVEDIFSKQGEAKVLWVTPPKAAKAEPCLFPVLFSEDRKWFLDTAAEGYVVVWSHKAPVQTRKAPPSKAPPSKATASKAPPANNPEVAPQNSVTWAIQASKQEGCGFEFGNEVAAELKAQIHAKQLGRLLVVNMQGKAK